MSLRAKLYTYKEMHLVKSQYKVPMSITSINIGNSTYCGIWD